MPPRHRSTADLEAELDAFAYSLVSPSTADVRPEARGSVETTACLPASEAVNSPARQYPAVQTSIPCSETGTPRLAISRIPDASRQALRRPKNPASKPGGLQLSTTRLAVPGGAAYLPASQNGQRAAARLRPVKHRKEQSMQHKHQGPMQIAAEEAIAHREAEPSLLQQAELLAVQPSVPACEAQLADVITALEQSDSPTERLPALQQANMLRGHCSSPARIAGLRAKHLQELQSLQPGWAAVVPAEGGIASICQAIFEGRMGHSLRIRSSQSAVCLKELVELPLAKKLAVMAEVSTRIAKARDWDARLVGPVNQQELQMTGEFVTLGAIFFNSSALGMIRAQQHPVETSSEAASARASPSMRDRLELSAWQSSLAKLVFQQRETSMAEISSERLQLLDDIGQLDAQARQRPCHSDVILKLLDSVTKLSENAAVQQEIWLHSNRQFIFRVCSPLNIQKLTIEEWPRIPDCPAALKFLAQGL